MNEQLVFEFIGKKKDVTPLHAAVLAKKHEVPKVVLQGVLPFKENEGIDTFGCGVRKP